MYNKCSEAVIMNLYCNGLTTSSFIGVIETLNHSNCRESQLIKVSHALCHPVCHVIQVIKYISTYKH